MAQQDNDQQQTTTPRSTWDLDPTHSAVEFSVKHLMFSKVRGRFRTFNATLDLDEGDPVAAALHVEIDTTSIDTGTEDRDGHLRSADFFDSDQYPQLTFRSTEVAILDEEHAKVTGELTIRGTTRVVTLDVRRDGQGTDPWGNTRAAYSAEGEIDRADFGLQWNQALETGGVLVGNKVRLHIEAQMVRRAG